jgi:Ca2+/Na+ antiporter
MSTFSEAGKGVPTELGPMALVGSSSFNLLIVSGLSIAGASELKKIYHYNSFVLSFAFATFACFWLFLVLMVMTPGWITFSEAIMTLSFYPLLLIFGWVIEKCSPQSENMAEELEINRRRMCKTSLMSIRDQKGALFVIDMATGSADPRADAEEMERIQEYYRIYLGRDDLSEATLEELISVLEPECPSERLLFRKGASGMGAINNRPLSAIRQGSFSSKVHEEFEKLRNPFVGFKFAKQTVGINAGTVSLTV